jgi:hypothetical protein
MKNKINETSAFGNQNLNKDGTEIPVRFIGAFCMNEKKLWEALRFFRI